MSCYEWVRATAHLVRERIAATTAAVLARRPPDDKEMRTARKRLAQQRRQDRLLKRDLLGGEATRRPPTSHILERDKRGTGWRCQHCREAVSCSTATATIRDWMEKPCGGPPPLRAITIT
eukprot:1697466-Pyramimonas_sp.AAC.1